MRKRTTGKWCFNVNISLSILFDWKYHHTSWKATRLKVFQSFFKAEVIYFLGKAPNRLGAWTCCPSLKPGKPLVIQPELCIILSQQEEAALHRVSSWGDNSPASPKLQRWKAEKVLHWNIYDAGMSPC